MYIDSLIYIDEYIGVIIRSLILSMINGLEVDLKCADGIYVDFFHIKMGHVDVDMKMSCNDLKLANLRIYVRFSFVFNFLKNARKK